MTTRVVFFDLFETLITEGEVSPPAGIPEEVYRCVRRESRHAAMTGRMSYADILRAAGADESTVEESDARRTTEKRAFLTNVEPRILDCLRQIRDGGMRISVISTCSADETAAWPESPLSTLVDDAVFSHEVGLMKPDRFISWHAGGSAYRRTGPRSLQTVAATSCVTRAKSACVPIRRAGSAPGQRNSRFSRSRANSSQCSKRGSVTFVRLERTNATPDSNQPTSYFSSQSQTTRP
jgi:hypothetical protein